MLSEPYFEVACMAKTKNCTNYILFGVLDDYYPKCKCAPDGEDSMFSIDVAKKDRNFFQYDFCRKKTLLQLLRAITPEVRSVIKICFRVCMWSTAMCIVCGFEDNHRVCTVVGA